MENVGIQSHLKPYILNPTSGDREPIPTQKRVGWEREKREKGWVERDREPIPTQKRVRWEREKREKGWVENATQKRVGWEREKREKGWVETYVGLSCTTKRR